MSDLVPTFIIEAILSDDGTKVVLRASARFVNKSNLIPITNDFVATLLAKNGYGKFKINVEQIADIVLALNDAIEQIDSEEDAKGFSIETDFIAEAINAFAEVSVADDKLEATINITPAQGGKHFSMNNAQVILEENKVTYGIDNQKIQALLDVAMQEKTTEVVSAAVAFAKLPIKGDDAQFIPLVETANERILRPRLLEDGTVDMHDLGDMPTVKESAHLMKKEPPTEGEKGINVYGEFIAPEPGDDIAFKLGPGTKISEEEPNILLSTISGQPNLLDCGMKVDDAIKVKAVDLHTGHLKTDANLIVKGDIAEGMKVRCEGDITIGGVIESADVKAKGNIIIGKGILGRTPEHSDGDSKLTVSVKAGGSILAMFASYAKLVAQEEIMIAEQLLHCDTTSIGKVVVGNEKTVGSQIVGGITRSSVSIEADILGASAGVFTRFDLSGPFNLKHYEVACNHSIIDGKTILLSNMRDAYSKFMTIPPSAARNEHIDKIKNTIKFLENEVIELEQRDQDLKDASEKLCQGLTVRAKRKIQPNVAVKIGHNKFKATRDRESGELTYDDGKIKYIPSNLD